MVITAVPPPWLPLVDGADAAVVVVVAVILLLNTRRDTIAAVACFQNFGPKS